MIRALFVAAGLLLASCATDAAPPPSASAHTVAPADLSRFFDCLRERGVTAISAHRGGYGPGAPENSLLAFESTLAAMPALLEHDIRQTADGALVIMHDETVDRTTLGQGRVDEMMLPQFKALRLKDEAGAPTNAAPPTLDETLAWSRGRTILQLDVKRGVPFNAVVRAVKDAGAQNRVIVIVYSVDDAVTVNRLDPSLMISVELRSMDELDRLIAAGVDPSRVLAWTGIRAPQPEFYAALRARGVEVLFGTVGRPDVSLDGVIAASGQNARYVEFAKTGVTMLATGRAGPAFAALSSAGVGDVGQCSGGQP